MAANLTPQYLKAEENYRRSQTPEEELRWLQVMLAEIPKHKASEKMQMILMLSLSAKKNLQSLTTILEEQKQKPLISWEDTADLGLMNALG